MSSTVLDNSPLAINSLPLSEQMFMDEDLLTSPERVLVTREMACFLADNGFLLEQYALHSGVLYSDHSRVQFLPITRQMFYALYNADLIDAKTELLDGVILAKMPQNKPHLNTLMFLQEWLISLFGFRQVRDQYPVDFDIDNKPINTPEPDVIVLNKSIILITEGNPTPNDILLCIEVADTTLRKDRVTKAKLYARAGIVEYWIADTNARTIIVHREPTKGKYQSVVTYNAEQEISCLAKPKEFKRVDELIAPILTETPQNTEQ